MGGPVFFLVFAYSLSAYLIVASVLDSDVLLEGRGASRTTNLIGRKGARFLFGGLGVFIGIVAIGVTIDSFRK